MDPKIKNKLVRAGFLSKSGKGTPKKFVATVLATGALYSKSLLVDALNPPPMSPDPVLQQAAGDLGNNGIDYKTAAIAFLTALGFDGTFVANLLPWDLLTRRTVAAAKELIDGSEGYPEGGCLSGIKQAIKSLDLIKP